MKWTLTADPRLKSVEGGLLERSPIIISVNKFDEDEAKKFSNSIGAAHNTGQPVIPVIIDSYGGEVYSLMSMISDIRNSDLPIATIVKGKAMSCGAFLLSCGAEGMRYATPDSTLMIHEVSTGAFGKIEEVTVRADEAERLNKRAFKILSENCGKDEKYFTKIIHDKKHADWYLTPKEAKRHNIVNHIGSPAYNIDISVNMKFE